MAEIINAKFMAEYKGEYFIFFVLSTVLEIKYSSPHFQFIPGFQCCNDTSQNI